MASLTIGGFLSTRIAWSLMTLLPAVTTSIFGSRQMINSARQLNVISADIYR
ncbi:hypothetical protein P0R31_05100 [Bradyrhizobium yuanmingense]|uniref:hypothetical protein n=1 Tax=Bradyrhizobium yuanmingense TaxID=108015 RepID=UPI0023BA3343|nr:hypothetical protein [Bradyrhizobium yuanmingense]MDF0516616.1 hypothetical protein [Bradyrhizobium yuanmingense]